MNTKPLWSILAAGVCLVLSTQSLQAAGNAEEGKKKFYSCGGCHAIEGYSNAYPNYHVPRLGGQHEMAVIASLKAYKSGDRKHGELPQGNSMQGNSSGWSDSDVADIAAYVSKKVLSTETAVITGNPGKGKEKTAVCAGCHGEDGNVLERRQGLESRQPSPSRTIRRLFNQGFEGLQEGGSEEPRHERHGRVTVR